MDGEGFIEGTKERGRVVERCKGLGTDDVGSGEIWMSENGLWKRGYDLLRIQV